MKTGFLLLNIATGAIFGLVSFFLVLIYSDPKEGGLLVVVLFYLSLFLMIMGFLSLLGFLFRKWKKTNPNMADILRISFRQAFLLSFLLVSVLLLQSLKIFFWWIGVILLLLVLLTEIFFSRNVQ